MILDAAHLERNQVLRGDVAIAGAGAAGITLARRLAGAGLDVLLLEGGGRTYSARSQSLYLGNASGTLLTPESLYTSSSRLRYLGGSTNHWGGYCIPMETIDFDHRPEIGRIGWPIQRSDLEPYAAETAALLGISPFASAHADRWPQQTLMPRNPRVATRAYHFSIPAVRFRVAHGDELAASRRIRLLLRANVMAVRLDRDGLRAEGLNVCAAPGRWHRIDAPVTVLAGGGIENARLLLASRAVHRRGVGNQHGLVGRFFMDHPERFVGVAVVPRRPPGLEAYESGATGPRVAVLRLRRAFKRKTGLLNAGLELVPRAELARPERTIAGLAGGGRADAPLVFDLLARGEPSPLRTSRVQLDRRRDRLGMPRVDLTWNLADRDLHSMIRTAEIVALELGRWGLGRVRLTARAEDPWAGTMWGSHHMGTTRMAASPRRGVVDADCRVHGLENLFVAGSSVFPTAGYANPTYTLVALTLRLADHLIARSGRG